MVAARLRIGTMLEVGSKTVHVREDGPSDGCPLLLIHGFAASMHWFDRMTTVLADTHRVIRIDLQGYGCTGGHEGLDARSQSRMVAAVLDTLDVKNVVAVGHSFGADVALAVAARSDRVGKVVVLSQAPDYSYATLPAAGILLGLPFVGDVLHSLATAPSVQFFAGIGFAPGFRIDSGLDSPNRMFEDHQAMSSRAQRAVLVERKNLLARRPLDEQIRELGLPTLAIHGRHDQMYDCDKSIERYAAAGASVAVIEGAGHSPNVERPVEVARLVRDFANR